MKEGLKRWVPSVSQAPALAAAAVSLGFLEAAEEPVKPIAAVFPRWLRVARLVSQKDTYSNVQPEPGPSREEHLLSVPWVRPRKGGAAAAWPFKEDSVSWSSSFVWLFCGLGTT